MTRTRGLYGWGVPTGIACFGQLRLVRPFFFHSSVLHPGIPTRPPVLGRAANHHNGYVCPWPSVSWMFELRINSKKGCLASASASGRRRPSRSGGQATYPQGCPQACPVGRWFVHGGRVHHYIPTLSPSNFSGSIPVSRGGSDSVSAKDWTL